MMFVKYGTYWYMASPCPICHAHEGFIVVVHRHLSNNGEVGEEIKKIKSEGSLDLDIRGGIPTYP